MTSDWVVVPRPPGLQANAVHVWSFPLRLPAESLEPWLTMLSPVEHQRAAAFAFDALRESYLAAHVTMRFLLSCYLACDPASVAYRIGEHGKPALVGADLHFNLSHTDDEGLLAVTRLAEVGVDIERIDRELDVGAIARRFFSARESADLAGRPAAERRSVFFDLWTCKEAWLKARGLPLSNARLIGTEFDCGTARLMRVDGDAASGWFVQSLRPSGNHAGAVALERTPTAVARFRFDPRAALREPSGGTR